MSFIRDEGTWKVKTGHAQMLKGGVIMDVVTPEHALIAQEAGAVAVMALERVPADIRTQGGVARMSDPEMIRGIQEVVTIPVMAKCRIGHFVEAQVLEALEIDFIDESEVLTPADESNHVDKWSFTVPFVCGATCLGEALRRIGEGAAMIRTKGEAGTGNVVEAVRHARSLLGSIRHIHASPPEELMTKAKWFMPPESHRAMGRTGMSDKASVPDREAAENPRRIAEAATAPRRSRGRRGSARSSSRTSSGPRPCRRSRRHAGQCPG